MQASSGASLGSPDATSAAPRAGAWHVFGRCADGPGAADVAAGGDS